MNKTAIISLLLVVFLALEIKAANKLSRTCRECARIQCKAKEAAKEMRCLFECSHICQQDLSKSKDASFNQLLRDMLADAAAESYDDDSYDDDFYDDK